MKKPQGFIRINKSTMEGLSLRERGLLTVIAEYCYITDRNIQTGFLYRNPCRASVGTLAKKANCHRNTIGRMLSRLEKKGTIKTERMRGRHPRIHIIDSPDKNEDVFDFEETESEAKNNEQILNAIESIKEQRIALSERRSRGEISTEDYEKKDWKLRSEIEKLRQKLND